MTKGIWPVGIHIFNLEKQKVLDDQITVPEHSGALE